MHATHNSITINGRTQSVELLNLHLAAAIDLHAQVKQAHWNVRGPAFIAVHQLFDRIADDVESYSDMIAERVGALGGEADGTIQKAAEKSFLIPYPYGLAEDHKHLFAVAAALAAFSDSARTAISATAGFGDPATADLFTEISRGVDGHVWFVESHVAPK